MVQTVPMTETDTPAEMTDAQLETEMAQCRANLSYCLKFSTEWQTWNGRLAVLAREQAAR